MKLYKIMHTCKGRIVFLLPKEIKNIFGIVKNSFLIIKVIHVHFIKN